MGYNIKKPFTKQGVIDVLNKYTGKNSTADEFYKSMSPDMREEFDRIMKEQFKHNPELYVDKPISK